MQPTNLTILFSVGFRPFFILAILYGAVVPILWGLIFAGRISLSFGELTAVLWHAHEMLFGFGLAVLGGFLLTASKNWVKVRGINGIPLMMLTALWLLERFAVYFPDYFGGYKSVLWIILNNLFLVSLSGYIITKLYKHRKNDSFPDNFFFYILLAMIILAKNLLLSETNSRIGLELSVGLFRLAFAVMFERTITQFMKNTENVVLIRKPYLDYPIKFLVSASAFSGFMADSPAGIVFLAAFVLLLFRGLLWQPLKAFKKFGNAVMYVGYFGLTLHFLLEGLSRFEFQTGLIGTTSLHVFTFLCMGLVIPAMLVRICQGHTGRKPQFTKIDKAAISLIAIASIFRLYMPSIQPQFYSYFISLASVCWSGCYILLATRLIPFCLAPRVDGKEH